MFEPDTMYNLIVFEACRTLSSAERTINSHMRHFYISLVQASLLSDTHTQTYICMYGLKKNESMVVYIFAICSVIKFR